jgi:hypothetical protein
VRYKKELERKDKAIQEGRANKTVIEISLEQQEYILALERVISILPNKPPEHWGEDALLTAKAYVKIIKGRLEVFDE